MRNRLAWTDVHWIRYGFSSLWLRQRGHHARFTKHSISLHLTHRFAKTPLHFNSGCEEQVIPQSSSYLSQQSLFRTHFPCRPLEPHDSDSFQGDGILLQGGCNHKWYPISSFFTNRLLRSWIVLLFLCLLTIILSLWTLILRFQWCSSFIIWMGPKWENPSLRWWAKSSSPFRYPFCSPS